MKKSTTLILFVFSIFTISSCATRQSYKEDNSMIRPEVAQKHDTGMDKKNDVAIKPEITAMQNTHANKINEKTNTNMGIAQTIPDFSLTDVPNLELLIHTNDDELNIGQTLQKNEIPVVNKKITEKKEILKKKTKIPNTPVKKEKVKTSKPKVKLKKEDPLNKKFFETKTNFSEKEKIITENNPDYSKITEEVLKDNFEILPEKDSNVLVQKPEFFSEFPSTEPYDSKETNISRRVKLYRGQRLEVVYPGEGWVYLGESTAQKGIKYQQRKLQNGSSIFNFGTENKGTYILNFSRFDAFYDSFISDSVLVTVEDSTEKHGTTVTAPAFKGLPVKEDDTDELKMQTGKIDKPLQNDIIKNETDKMNEISAKTPIKEDDKKNEQVYDTPGVLLTAEEKNENKQELVSAKGLLDKIRKAISAGKSEEALNDLDMFFKNYSEHLDEALFLRGQAYELNGPHKNIKLALKSYQTLLEAYPKSEKWDAAYSRIRYIKKFYIDIN